MNAIRKALIRVHRECPDFPVERPKPSETWDCLKPRFSPVLIANHKRCGRCRAVKPFDAFHRNNKGSTGRQSVCKACRSADTKKRRAA